MKRKITFALALLLVGGAALWGVNYRLDHPPLTQADKEFHALVAGADNVLIQERPRQAPWYRENTLQLKQTRELLEISRFLSVSTANNAEQVRYSLNSVNLRLTFREKTKNLAHFDLYQDRQRSEFTYDNPPYPTYQLNPRFNKRLNRALDAYLPQRIRP